MRRRLLALSFRGILLRPGFLPFLALQSKEEFSGGLKVSPIVVSIVNEDLLSLLDGSGGHDENTFFALPALDFVVCVVGQTGNPAYSTGVVGISSFGPGSEVSIDAAVFGDENGITLMSLLRTLLAFRPGDDLAFVFANDITPAESLQGEEPVAGLRDLTCFYLYGIGPVRARAFYDRMFLHGRAKISA